jgi:hypothetical protein
MHQILDWRGRSVDCACDSCVHEHAVEIEREYYEMDSVVFDSDGNAYVLESGTYFVSSLTSEIHCMDLRHELPNGDECTIFEAVDTGNWTLVSEKVNDKKIPKLLLKPWLEIDEHGDVINRQPELLDVGLPGVDCDMGCAA